MYIRIIAKSEAKVNLSLDRARALETVFRVANGTEDAHAANYIGSFHEIPIQEGGF